MIYGSAFSYQTQSLFISVDGKTVTLVRVVGYFDGCEFCTGELNWFLVRFLNAFWRRELAFYMSYPYLFGFVADIFF